MMYYIWLSLCLASLVIGATTTFVLLYKYKSNWPAIVAFIITLLLSTGCVVGVSITSPEEQRQEYKYCTYCGKEINWEEVK